MKPERAVVVIPAHNEAASLPPCLEAVSTAAASTRVPVLMVVVLDSCDDESAGLADQFGPNVQFVDVAARRVGAARRAGFHHARRWCDEAGVDESRIWYATTDADSRVDPDWLTRQFDADADVVLGVVRIDDWRRHPAALVRRYRTAYRNERRGDGHGHVHGANMGFTARAYWETGGFASLRTGEDVELVRRFETRGYRIRRDDQLSVLTSSRRIGRAPKGFAHYLDAMSSRVRRDTA